MLQVFSPMKMTYIIFHIHPSAFVSPKCILTSAVNARPTVWTHARSQVRVLEKNMGNMLLSAICSISNIPSFETWFSLIQTENHYNSLMPGIAGVPRTCAFDV
jgi:hypothetical protein